MTEYGQSWYQSGGCSLSWLYMSPHMKTDLLGATDSLQQLLKAVCYSCLEISMEDQSFFKYYYWSFSMLGITYSLELTPSCPTGIWVISCHFSILDIVIVRLLIQHCTGYLSTFVLYVQCLE